MPYENRIVKLFKDYFKLYSINAYAFRLKQAKYSGQICDVLIDSADKTYYLAVECKTTKYGLFFSSNFSKNQVENITSYLELSGRKGVLALKDRGQQYLIPWQFVLTCYKTQKGIHGIDCLEYMIDYKNLQSIKQNLASSGD